MYIMRCISGSGHRLSFLEQLLQLFPELRRVLVAVNGHGVLDRRFQQFLVRVGGNGTEQFISLG